MTFLMNLLWIICGGLPQALLWFLAGCLWSITIVGLPVGVQCFKFAGFCLTPFGRTVEYGGGAVSFLMNLLWLLVSGIPLTLGALANGLALCMTIIGIPFGLQCFKFAKLALMPFGARVVPVRYGRSGY